jgi:hypothetical protein
MKKTLASGVARGGGQARRRRRGWRAAVAGTSGEQRRRGVGDSLKPIPPIFIN